VLAARFRFVGFISGTGRRGYNPAMQHADFEEIVREALAELPEWVREALQNIEVLVLDEADAHLDPDGEGLLGLYTGVPLTEREANHAGELPDVIYIFRLPHLELGLPPEALDREIRHTLIHEIAHYFGMDDDHVEELGWG
jgi:predicted Zn-dependent protease with MMP-like domain